MLQQVIDETKMVEQMVSSNLSKYGLGKCPNIVTTTTTADNQAVSLVDTTDEQNGNKHLKSTEDSALQKEDAVTQAKGPLPGASINNVNRNLVYARRKSDVDLSNTRTSEKNRTSGYQQAEQQLELSPQKENESFANIPVTSIATGIKSFENEQSAMVNMPAMEHWNARFSKLHKYVQQCDTANQEVYLQSEFYTYNSSDLYAFSIVI